MKIYIPFDKAEVIAFDNGYGLPVIYLYERARRTGDTIVITFGKSHDPKRSTMTIAPEGINYAGEYLLGKT